MKASTILTLFAISILTILMWVGIEHYMSEKSIEVGEAILKGGPQPAATTAMTLVSQQMVVRLLIVAIGGVMGLMFICLQILTSLSEIAKNQHNSTQNSESSE